MDPKRVFASYCKRLLAKGCERRDAVITLKDNEGVGRWVLQQAGDTQPFNVTIGFVSNTLANAQGFVDAMEQTWQDNLKASTTTDLSLVGTEALWFDGTNEHTVAHDSGTAGTGGTGVLPSNCALLVGKRTFYAGRKYRGRMYWPSMLAEGDVDINGEIDAGVVTALQGHFDDVFADLDAVSVSVFAALLHDKVTAGVLDDTPATALAGFTVKPKIATQRRRMRGSS